MKNVLLKRKDIKSLNKFYFVENKTYIMWHVLKINKYPSCIIYKMHF